LLGVLIYFGQPSKKIVLGNITGMMPGDGFIPCRSGNRVRRYGTVRARAGFARNLQKGGFKKA